MLRDTCLVAREVVVCTLLGVTVYGLRIRWITHTSSQLGQHGVRVDAQRMPCHYVIVNYATQ